MSTGKNTHELFTLYKSKSIQKKFDVYIKNSSGRTKKVSFGGRGYSDYTLHKDKERRHRYRIRHKTDKINDPNHSGFWSWYVLWGHSTDRDVAFKDAVRRAKKLLE